MNKRNETSWFVLHLSDDRKSITKVVFNQRSWFRYYRGSVNHRETKTPHINARDELDAYKLGLKWLAEGALTNEVED